MNKHAYKGFTLIELMITVVVIGILAAIALPAYQDYVKRARRADAKTSLLSVQSALEKYRANHTTYTTDLTDLGYAGASNQASNEGYYIIDLPVAASAAAYTITASINTATTQNGDACGKFSIIKNGATTSYTADGDPAIDCWGK